MIVNGQNVSLVLAHDVLSKLERESGMRGEYVQPTYVFLRKVKQWLGSLSIEVTLDGAWEFWRLVFYKIELLREKSQIQADIAFWFGVDPYKLTEEQLAGLAANLYRVRAQDMLRRGSFSPTDYNSVYKLVLLATGDKSEAQEAKTAALELHVDNEIKKAARNAII